MQLDCAYAAITVVQSTLKLPGVNDAGYLKCTLISQVPVKLNGMLVTH
jgi:hypothetical protein